MDNDFENTIPVPHRKPRKAGVSAKLRAMEIGASFLDTADRRSNLFATASQLGIRLCTRTDNDNPKMIRVWRVK